MSDTAEPRRHRFGDRKDAWRVRGLDGLHTIFLYVMPKRTESEVSLTEDIDVTELMKFIKEENDEKGTNLKFFHAFVTAVAKTARMRPRLNWFISGKRYWERKDLTLSFIVKREFADGSDESMLVLNCKPELTLYDISKIILGDTAKVRKEGHNSMDDLLNIFGKFPRWFLTFFFFILRRLEYHGIMPNALTDGDMNYSSIMLSNLGSIRCEAPYHHLSNYGTCSMMITIGNLHKEMVYDEKGEGTLRDIVSICVTADERIADGFYFAKSIRLLKYILANPQLLCEPIGNGVEDYKD